MYTSDKQSFKRTLVYVLTTIFCALFGIVYESFSHGVYSNGMIYAFAFPLVLGVLPSLLISRLPMEVRPKSLTRFLYDFGVATLTIGSLMSGVLEIYGTDNPLTGIYWIAGGAFLAAGLVSYGISLLPSSRSYSA